MKSNEIFSFSEQKVRENSILIAILLQFIVKNDAALYSKVPRIQFRGNIELTREARYRSFRYCVLKIFGTENRQFLCIELQPRCRFCANFSTTPWLILSQVVTWEHDSVEPQGCAN